MGVWVRNPWRASFDRATGDLWLADVGQGRYEEVNRFAPLEGGKGADLGWSRCEGDHASPPAGDPSDPDECTAPGVTPPLLEYEHAAEVTRNCAAVGGYVYRGSGQPTLAGRYLYADYCSGRIWTIPADTSPVTRSLHRWWRAASSPRSGRTRRARSTSAPRTGPSGTSTSGRPRSAVSRNTTVTSA